MKSSIKIKQLRLSSFLESMRGLMNRSRFLKHPRKLKKELVIIEPEIDIHFPLIEHGTLPLNLNLTLGYDDDPLKVLHDIKVDYSLLEVNESVIQINTKLKDDEERVMLLNNLKVIAKSYSIDVEELNHVNH
ncbi:MAG: hypothetical protein KGZ84_00620 [Erysipelotrichia bacterium]|jgi:hypothetical protein|nr:hypothetical protein [Erysipelotrichia bacterium]